MSDPPAATIIDEHRAWAAVAARDASWDGAVVCGVITTGIFCRPSCPGRPHRKNVRCFATAHEARAAGLRACLRCDPEAAPPRPQPAGS